MPRHLFSIKGMEKLAYYQFHLFVDGRKRAYGEIVLVRFRNSDGKYHSNLVNSKTKVIVPVQEKALPRFKLFAALIGASLFYHILLHLSIPRDVKANIWSDSMIVLHWIKNNF